MSEKNFKAGDKVWHAKTKIFGIIFGIFGDVMKGGERVPEDHVGVLVMDAVLDHEVHYIWSIESLELLDDEEFKLTEELTKWKKRKTELNKLVDEAGKEYSVAETAMLEFLIRTAKQGTRQYAGIGQVTIDGKNIYASIPKEKEEAAFKEIEEMGRGEIIKRTIHSATLKSFVSELQDTGIPVPKNISVYETPALSFAKKK